MPNFAHFRAFWPVFDPQGFPESMSAQGILQASQVTENCKKTHKNEDNSGEFAPYLQNEVGGCDPWTGKEVCVVFRLYIHPPSETGSRFI